MNGHTIYVLCDPSTRNVRYVGYTKNTRLRLSGHLCAKSGSHKDKWVRSLRRSGKVPLLRPICVVSNVEEAKRVEMAVIALYRRRGERLTNSTDGGEGVTGVKWTNAMRIRRSEASKEFWSDPKNRAKHSKLMKENNPAARLEVRAKVSAVWTPEKRLEFGKLIKARLTVEHQRKMTIAAAEAKKRKREELEQAVKYLNEGLTS